MPNMIDLTEIANQLGYKQQLLENMGKFSPAAKETLLQKALASAANPQPGITDPASVRNLVGGSRFVTPQVAAQGISGLNKLGGAFLPSLLGMAGSATGLSDPTSSSLAGFGGGMVGAAGGTPLGLLTALSGMAFGNAANSLGHAMYDQPVESFPSGSELRAERRGTQPMSAEGQPPVAGQAAGQVDPQTSGPSTMSPAAQGQEAAVKNHEDLLKKMMMINGDIEAQDWSPMVKQMARGSMSKHLLNAGFQDPMMLGMWVQHGSDAFEKLRQIQESNKKQSGGLTYAQRMGLQAGVQAGQQNIKEEQSIQSAVNSIMTAARTKGGDPVKMAQELGLGDAVQNNSWWNKHIPLTSNPSVNLSILESRLRAGHKPLDVADMARRAMQEAERAASGVGIKDQEMFGEILNQ
jgi:hypothetical protein